MSSIPQRDWINRENAAMLLHLAIVPFAEAFAAARKFVADFAPIDAANGICEFRFVVSLVVGVAKGLEVLGVIICRVVVFVVNVVPFRRQLAMLTVIGKAMRALIGPVDIRPLALSLWNVRLLNNQWVAVGLPAIVMHHAPATAEPQFFAAVNFAGETGLETFRSGSSASSTRWAFRRGISKATKTVVVHVAQSPSFAQFVAIFKSALDVFHSLNIPLTSALV